MIMGRKRILAEHVKRNKSVKIEFCYLTLDTGKIEGDFIKR